MNKLFFSLTTLLFVFVSAEPRTPKIYNVLISTKKNLSPSHAVPVFEPVLRTTSLGVALPPLFYQPPGLAGYQPLVSDNFQGSGTSKGTIQENEQNNEDAQETLPAEQLIPYSYSPYFVNTQGYYPQVIQGQPSIQQPQQVQSTEHPHYSPQQAEPRQQLLQQQHPQQLLQQQPLQQYVEDPKTLVANLKRNPNIPDVPPPALPVRTTS